jgi:hypothetical protein
MPASVTNLQTAFKAAIDAAPSDSWAVPISTRIADDDVSDPPAVGVPADIIIGFEAGTTLVGTTNRSLDQYLIPVTVRRRYPVQDQSALDQLHLLTQQLRDLVSGFSSAAVSTTTGDMTTVSDAQRVETLLTPHPFDQPQSRTPGLFVSRFVCDCDVVRTFAAPSSPAIDPSPLLTSVRNAVWDSIDNWAPFAAAGDVPAAWSRKFRSNLDLEELALHDPGPGDLPAIAVNLGPVNPDWWVNVMQNWPQALFVTFWLHAHQLDTAEWRAVQLMQAFYKCCPPNSTVSFIRTASGRPPSKNSPITLEPVALGRTQSFKAWRGTIALTINGQLDPNA